MTTSYELSKCPALVLVGGIGSRLRPAYSEGPKAMAPIGERPFLFYLMRQLVRAGFTEVVLCLGHGNEQIREWVEGRSELGINVTYSVEAEPLGTGGAIRLAASDLGINGSFFVMNGDSILQLDFEGLLQSHQAHGKTGTVALTHVPDTERYGAVETDELGRIVEFREKSAVGSPGYVNGGTYVFEPRVVELIAAEGPVSVERSVLPALCPVELYGFRCQGYFIDIGIPQDYQRAQSELRGLSWL
jgi:D-glycero-alpha-D-manno-heptose 1-phosphate guanylyltransferase